MNHTLVVGSVLVLNLFDLEVGLVISWKHTLICSFQFVFYSVVILSKPGEYSLRVARYPSPSIWQLSPILILVIYFSHMLFLPNHFLKCNGQKESWGSNKFWMRLSWTTCINLYLKQKDREPIQFSLPSMLCSSNWMTDATVLFFLLNIQGQIIGDLDYRFPLNFCGFKPKCNIIFLKVVYARLI